MAKKLLFGGIITIIVIIGLSFTSVVGYNSVKSDVKLSPLFNQRFRMTIDGDFTRFNSNYLGKDEDVELSIPKRDNAVTIYLRVIDEISNMGDAELKVLKENLFKEIRKQFRFTDEGLNHLSESLDFIKENPDVAKAIYSNAPSDDDTLGSFTYGDDDSWFPGCIFTELITRKYGCTYNRYWVPFCFAAIPVVLVGLMLAALVLVGVFALVWPVVIAVLILFDLGAVDCGPTIVPFRTG